MGDRVVLQWNSCELQDRQWLSSQYTPISSIQKIGKKAQIESDKSIFAGIQQHRYTYKRLLHCEHQTQ